MYQCQEFSYADMSKGVGEPFIGKDLTRRDK